MKILNLLEALENIMEINLSTTMAGKLTDQDFSKIKELIERIKNHNGEDFHIYDLVGAFKKLNTNNARLFFGGYGDLKVKGRPTGYEGGADPVQRIYSHFPDLPKVDASEGAIRLLPPLVDSLIDMNILSTGPMRVGEKEVTTYNKLPSSKMDGLSKAMKFYSIFNVQRSASEVINYFNEYKKEFMKQSQRLTGTTTDDLQNVIKELNPEHWSFVHGLYKRKKQKKGYLDNLLSSDKLERLQNAQLVTSTDKGYAFNDKNIEQIVEFASKQKPLDLYLNFANSKMKDTMLRILAEDENGRYLLSKENIDNILSSDNPSHAISKLTRTKTTPVLAKMFKRFLTFRNPKPTINEITRVIKK